MLASAHGKNWSGSGRGSLQLELELTLLKNDLVFYSQSPKTLLNFVLLKVVRFDEKHR